MTLIGADPELFFANKQGIPASVIGLLGGSKEAPLPIGKGCAIQEDNVAAEFCIPPANSANEFIQSISYSLKELKKRARDFNLTFSEKASENFPEQELRSPVAHIFGCDPDYNAYTKQENPKPKADNPFLRSAGGHVHVSTKKDIFDLVKCLDFYLGVPSVVLDEDNQRRLLYGKAGALRPKPYGVEYRTLSNFWIWKKELIKWIYDTTTFVEANVQDLIEPLRSIHDDVIDTINSGNKEKATQLISKYNIGLPVCTLKA